MTTRLSPQAFDDLVEFLADIEHARWSHWQLYMHGKCARLPDGSLTVPADLAQRWERQATTPYAQLSESEKRSDREQVHHYLFAVMEAFGIVPPEGAKPAEGRSSSKKTAANEHGVTGKQTV
jgi:hypothetical protein